MKNVHLVPIVYMDVFFDINRHVPFYGLLTPPCRIKIQPEHVNPIQMISQKQSLIPPSWNPRCNFVGAIFIHMKMFIYSQQFTQQTHFCTV